MTGFKTDAANYITEHGKKLPKGKIAFYVTLYGLAATQAWDFVTWLF